jgi:hypothetical protein
MSKLLVDIDEGALDDAQRQLGTSTIKDTINVERSHRRAPTG